MQDSVKKIVFISSFTASFFLFSLLDLVNGRSEQGSDVDGNGSSDQRPFIVVAAASSSSENDADPNEAFIPTNDDNDANRPGFKLLTQEDLQRHSVLPTLKLNPSFFGLFLGQNRGIKVRLSL